MDSIEDFKHFLKDRFGSPFWLSSIASWLIINWPITITAIFQFNEFDRTFVDIYLQENTHWRYIFGPLIIGAIYAVGSATLRESLEVFAKFIRAFVIKRLNALHLYDSISIKDHELEIRRLQVQFNRVRKDNEDYQALVDENGKLTEQINGFADSQIKISDIIQEKVLNQSDLDEVKKQILINRLLEAGLTLSYENDVIDEVDLTNIETVNTKSDEDWSINGWETENEHQKEATSKFSILKALLSFESAQVYGLAKRPSAVKMDPSAFDKTIQICVTSEYLVSKSQGRFTITDSGKEEIQRLLQLPELSNFKLFLDDLYLTTKEEIISQLSAHQLEAKELAARTTFNPFFVQAITELRDIDKKIELRGNTYALSRS